ncbi:hypothetical protein PENNAL_c0006G10372 [Penicillium nalgiovense]|uniref:Glycosyltransferase family 28 N-terminal domain-containing protein n=1 Tax=Penicillium nalgiovense TaxID=60175 RepID=A0A1V6YZX9_PENNA|nr:hypothetical protein PENNAL_c0006G10372 [Penicillium nalgiovense]
MSHSQVHPSRKILLVVTTGGFHTSPVLEIGRVLAERDHQIEFATLEKATMASSIRLTSPANQTISSLSTLSLGWRSRATYLQPLLL